MSVEERESETSSKDIFNNDLGHCDPNDLQGMQIFKELVGIWNFPKDAYMLGIWVYGSNTESFS